MAEKIVRIGGASGAFVDSAIAVPQLLKVPDLDYLVFDYLAEGSMSIFGKMQAANPALGYMPDFVDVHVGPYLAEMKAKGVKAVANAGGLNPRGLAAALRKRAEEMGVKLTVAAIDGDDLRDRQAELDTGAIRDMFSGKPFPAVPVTSINAYLGAFPIAAALARGADIVVTGRVVDSALILGPLIHEFGWKETDYDLLAAGTVSGHLLECGCQVTGGTFTDWQDVPDWAHSGFPVGECRADGSIVMTKPAGTGGLVSVGTVTEQLLYEVSDPQCYIVPDVVVDFSQVKVTQDGSNRVKVSGARGYPPTASYKVCVTYDEGWRSIAMQPIVGFDAARKAERQASAVLERTREMLRDRNLADWRRSHIEIIGAEASYGERARDLKPREVVARIVVEHEDKRAADLFWREQCSAIMTMSVGTTIGLASPVMPITHLFSFLIDRSKVTARVTMQGETVEQKGYQGPFFKPEMIERPVVVAGDAGGPAEVPLIDLAWGRSGDKGDLFNVAVIARRPEFLPHIRSALTSEALGRWYRHVLEDPAQPKVDRYEAPGPNALNFVVHRSLAGGINDSPRLDPAAKTMAQQLLEFPVPVPREVAAQIQSGAR